MGGFLNGPNPPFPPISRVKIAPWQASGTSENYGEMSRRTLSAAVNPIIFREITITHYFRENVVVLAIISPIITYFRVVSRTNRQ